MQNDGHRSGLCILVNAQVFCILSVYEVPQDSFLYVPILQVEPAKWMPPELQRGLIRRERPAMGTVMHTSFQLPIKTRG